MQLYEKLNPFSKLIIILLIITVSFLVVFFIGVIIAIPIYGISFETLDAYMENAKNSNINFLKYIQVIQTIGLFVVPAIIIGYFSGQKGKYLKINKKPDNKSVLTVIAITLISIPVINMLIMFNQNIDLPSWLNGLETILKDTEKSVQELTDKFLMANSTKDLIVNLFVIALLPAIGEELFFRGMLQSYLSDFIKDIHKVVFIQAVIFSAFHFQFYGFIPRFFLGLLFGYYVYWSKSLWLSIIAHFTNNAISVIAYFVMHMQNKSSDTIDEVGTTQDTMFTTIISMIFLAIMLANLYKNEKNKQENNTQKI